MLGFAHHLSELLSQPVYLKVIVRGTLILRENTGLKQTYFFQRHCVREVPVTEVRSQWKQHEFTFWVYGNENHVYCPDYPAKCFTACSII